VSFMVGSLSGEGVKTFPATINPVHDSEPDEREHV
jgi:hypothetical protein